MKKIPAFLLLILVSINTFSQDLYLDENNDVIESEVFQKNWRDTKLNLYRWDYIKKDSGRVAKLFRNEFNYYKANYDTICKEIKKITNKEIPSNANIIIEFIFSHDYCNSSEKENEWSKRRLKNRLNFLSEVTANVKSNNSANYYIVLFDKGLIINDYINTIDFFYCDKNNYFKSTFFKYPAFCGSYLLIKPDGFVLNINGESRADFLVNYLDPINWKKTFQKKE
jgi:hypothetical protein